MSADHDYLSPSGVYTVLLLRTHKSHIMIWTTEWFKRSAWILRYFFVLFSTLSFKSQGILFQISLWIVCVCVCLSAPLVSTGLLYVAVEMLDMLKEICYTTFYMFKSQDVISRCLDQRQKWMNHNNVEMYSPALLCFCMLLACFSFISNYGAVLRS